MATLLQPSLDQVKQALSNDFFSDRHDNINDTNNNNSTLLSHPATSIVQSEDTNLFHHFSRLSLSGGSSLKFSIFGAIGKWMSLLRKNAAEEGSGSSSSFLKSSSQPQEQQDWTQFCKDILTSALVGERTHH